jgi:CheY-like chemotaxis protein
VTLEKEFIMVVEDEDEAREILLQILEFEGFQVRGFANGAEALDYLKGGPAPCLIVLDVVMPVMDGREFRAAVLKNPGWARIPTIVVTALESSVVRDLSAIKVLRKPVDVEALLSVVRQNC